MRGLVGQHGAAAVVVEDPHELGVDDHDRPVDPDRRRVGERELRQVEVGHVLEVERVEALAVQDPDVRQLVLAEAHGGAERGGAQRALVAQGDEPAHHLVEVGDLVQRGGRGAVGGVLVGPRRDALELPCVDGKCHAKQAYPRATPRLDSAAMRAATIRDGEVVVAEHPDPEPGAGEVLVRVRAAGLNGADIHQRAGHYPAPPGSPQDIPGLELAGEVAARGPGRRALRRGRPRDGHRRRRRAGRAGHGARAPAHARPRRPELGRGRAACPEVFTTAHDALFTQAGLRAGERLLVHGAAGGVGTAGVQLGATAGAHVTATRAQRGPARRRRRARRPRGDRSRGLRRARAVRRRPRARRRSQPARRPAGARHQRAHRRHRHRGRRQGRGEPRRA